MPEIIESNGQFFPDGEAIEIVRADDQAGELGVAHWNRQVVQVTSTLDLSGKTYRPPVLDASFVRALHLPSNILTYGSASALVDDLAKTLQKYVGLSVQFARLISFFLLGTWMRDTQAISPRLLIVGPASRELDQLTKLLARFCRHGILLSGVTPNAILSLPFAFGLTLIIRERRLREGLKPLLDAATSKDRNIPMNGGRLINPFCSVILITETPFDGAATGADIEIPVWPASGGVPRLDTATASQIGLEIQNKLLAFRLENFAMARSARFDPPELLSAFRDIACSLGSCIPNEPDLQKEIASLLRDCDKHARIVKSTNPEAVLLEALLFLCHERSEPHASIHVGELANAMRVINQGRGETNSPSPRGVGEILRGLGFQTTRLGKSGRGILLCRDISERVHELAVNFGVPSMREGTPGCTACENARKMGGNPKKGR
jgi:hypothetical protein